MAETPFSRFTPKNYEDSVRSMKKSVTGNELPNARQIVQEVLTKAKKYSRTSNEPGELFFFAVLLVNHDVAFQVPSEAINSCKEIRCCAKQNKGVLDSQLQNSECAPIAISKDDSFYNESGVKCLNFLRSEVATSPEKIQYGEILNKVTSAMDLSIIYGSQITETNKIRSFVDGKLNTGTKNVLPTDKFGEYTSVSTRLTSVVQSAIFPTLFTRNHNHMCDDLKALNPHWNDETLFQESRRINIAIIQKIVLGGTTIESVFKRKVNESYSENLNPATSLEFTTSAYRFLHYYLNPYMKLVTSDNVTTKIPLSETFGRMDLIEDRFDDVMRGVLNNKMNVENYSDESEELK